MSEDAIALLRLIPFLFGLGAAVIVYRLAFGRSGIDDTDDIDDSGDPPIEDEPAPDSRLSFEELVENSRRKPSRRDLGKED